MWLIVPTPSGSCPSVQAAPDWITDLTSPLMAELARSAGLSGKLSPPTFWRRAWKRAPWIRRLCGRISEPSTAARGVKRWIASLRDIPASPSARRVAAAGRMILATCGPKSTESFRRYVPPSSFWRMSQGTLDLGLEPSLEISGDQATELRRLSSERRTWAHPISGNGCSSLQWQTAGAKDVDSAGGPNQPSLTRDIRENWATPTKSPQGGRFQYSMDGKGGMDTASQVEHWPTPTDKSGDQTVKNPTPGQTGGTTLGGAARFLFSLSDLEIPKPGPESLPSDPTSRRQWHTPKTPTGGGVASRKATGGGERKLEDQVQEAQTGKRLNPIFVFWLMGWNLDATYFGLLETALSLWRRRMRSALCGLL